MNATRLMVWIDQDLCTGDGICEEIAPDVFLGRDDGLWVVKEEASNFGATIIFDGGDGGRHFADIRQDHHQAHHSHRAGADGGRHRAGSDPALRARRGPVFGAGPRTAAGRLVERAGLSNGNPQNAFQPLRGRARRATGQGERGSRVDHRRRHDPAWAGRNGASRWDPGTSPRASTCRRRRSATRWPTWSTRGT